MPISLDPLCSSSSLMSLDFGILPAYGEGFLDSL